MTISLAHPEDFGIRAKLLDRSRPIEPRLYLYVERELARSTDSASFILGSIGSALPHPHTLPRGLSEFIGQYRRPAPIIANLGLGEREPTTHSYTNSFLGRNLPSSGGVAHANQLSAIIPFAALASAEGFPPGLQKGERHHRSFHARPYGQGRNEIIQFSGGLSVDDQHESNCAARRSACQNLFFVLQFFAELQCRENILLDECRPSSGVVGRP